MSESQTPVQDQRCQSRPSARNSVIFSGGDSPKNYGADQQKTADLRSSFRQIPHTSNVCLLEEKIQDRSQFLTEAMHWIKEVEMVGSVDELRSSSSLRGISMPNFEVLDARIASALNRIIHNSRFKEGSVWRNKKAKRGPFPTRKTDCLPDLRVLRGHRSQ